jgi:beta-N-acetylhexosaminidase
MDYMRDPMPTAVLRQTVAGLFMVGIPGTTLDATTRDFLEAYHVGGVILFKRNVGTARQLRSLVAAIHETGAGVRPLVGIDHEGGRVDRLRRRPFTHFPPMSTVGATRDPRLAEAVGLAMGRELAAIGIDVDFAPSLDVWSNPRNQVIGDRAFGTTAAAVTKFALPFARGLMRGGVIACGKHFPGHGDTVGDSHFVLPRVKTTRAGLAKVELPPFRRAIAAGFPALMTAHVVYPALDRLPATLSRKIAHDLLRRRLGFEGVLVSDDLDMRAVAARWTPDRLAPAALRAGCDMLLACQSLDVAAQGIEGAVRAVEHGQLDPAAIATSLGRIQQLRRRIARRRPSTMLGWPAHARLLRRIERAVLSASPIRG